MRQSPVMKSVIVWDIETVPDFRGYAAVKGMGAAAEDQVREASSGLAAYLKEKQEAKPRLSVMAG
jgi:hypothetical protein